MRNTEQERTNEKERTQNMWNRKNELKHQLKCVIFILVSEEQFLFPIIEKIEI